MPFIHAQLAVPGIDTDVLDAARDVYRKEISCWRIVGPAQVKGKESWLASRNSDVAILEFAQTLNENEAVPLVEPDIEAMEFSEKGYAMDFVMWRALGKAIAHYNEALAARPKIIGVT